MGMIWSKQKTDPNDYERILSELDSKIQEAEVRLTDIKIRQRRTGVLWVIYSTIVWVVYLGYCLLTLHGQDVNIHTFLTALPAFLFPICIYYTRKLLGWFYSRKQTSEEALLTALRAEQKLKVEELKKKTSYYSTQSLLDRYDEAAQKKKREQERLMQLQKQQQQQQQQHFAQKKPVSMPAPRTGPAPQGGSSSAGPMSGIANKGPSGNPGFVMMPPPPPPRAPQWYDKIVDALVGDDGPETKYALICNHCFTHNGLVLPNEIDTIQYVCPHCKHFNPSRKSRQLHPDGPVIPPQTPTPAISPSPTSAQLPQHDTDETVGRNQSPDAANSAEGTETPDEVIAKYKQQIMDEQDESIAERVRRRRVHKNGEEGDESDS
ncbi:uncharacterized protein BYT42DRAFT_607990 [Radiomyces spectabilis]|uniref:uncharacterized protein n=1 Tax=Radiomyces spectabilis TaxID=64574 RepID=UPI0022202C7E|nr:uncharacterized protein BYT42DRAFT_607990 [Radiomyces spectabilis]KAI8369629.1 hypothetical protein BYT42DRAFT_607990 [Radiomyces spectabilis]